LQCLIDAFLVPGGALPPASAAPVRCAPALNCEHHVAAAAQLSPVRDHQCPPDCHNPFRSSVAETSWLIHAYYSFPAKDVLQVSGLKVNSQLFCLKGPLSVLSCYSASLNSSLHCSLPALTPDESDGSPLVAAFYVSSL
jgi:hypothetical protein